MTADRVPTSGDAKTRATVTFPGKVPGTTMTGRLMAVKGDKARIMVRRRAWVTRRVDQVRLLTEPPRAVGRQDLPDEYDCQQVPGEMTAPRSLP